MSKQRVVVLILALVALCATSVIRPDPVLAGRKTYEDKRLGFKFKIDDGYTQNPPKLTADSAFIVGDWYQDKAKFDSWQLSPTFQIYWFVTPKETAGAAAAAPEDVPFDPSDPEAYMKAMRAQFSYHSVDEAFDSYFETNTHLYGEAVPMKDRWEQGSKDKTSGKVEFQVAEVNVPTKKRNKDLHGYAYLAKLTIDRPDETIEVGFIGSCSVDYHKQFSKEFPAMVRSFEALKTATDSRNEAANADLSQDREARYKQILETKLVKGWKADRTSNYILVYHEDVDSKLVEVQPPVRATNAAIIKSCLIRMCSSSF